MQPVNTPVQWSKSDIWYPPARAGVGRVEMWRSSCRPNISVAAPFVWRCLTDSAVALFPHLAHRQGRGLARRFRPKFVSPVGSPFRLRVSQYLGRDWAAQPSEGAIFS